MSDEDKEISYQYLAQLREWINEGKVSSWIYVAISSDTVFNAAVAPHVDAYRLIGMLDATKTALIHQTSLFQEPSDAA
jgi:hypothetical protein